MSTLILDTSTRWGVHDIETTGLTEADRIVQFGMCLFHGRHQSDAVDLLINPGIPIRPEISDLHGITTEMVADKQTMAQLGPVVHAALTDRQLAVAFNGRLFDDHWLVRELASAGIEYSPKPIVDVFDFLWYFRRDAAEDGKGHKLTDWVERAGLPAFDAHSAVADCAATGQLMIWAIDQGIIPETVEHAVALGEAIGQFIDREKDLYGTAFYLDRKITDPPASVRMGFGKHRGANLNQMPTGYLSWLVEKSDQPDKVKQIARSILRGTLMRPHEDLLMLREHIESMLVPVSPVDIDPRAVLPLPVKAVDVPDAPVLEVASEAGVQHDAPDVIVTCPLCEQQTRSKVYLFGPRNWSRLCDTCRKNLPNTKREDLCLRCVHRAKALAEWNAGAESPATPREECANTSSDPDEYVKACPDFQPINPAFLSGLRGLLGLEELWAASSEEGTVVLTFITRPPVGAEDNADAVILQEKAAHWSMALDSMEAIHKGQILSLSTWVDTSETPKRLTMDETPIPIRSALSRFMSEFFCDKATFYVQRTGVNRLTVALVVQHGMPEGLLRLTARCLSSLLCEVAEELDSPWAAFIPFADVRVFTSDSSAISFGIPTIPLALAEGGWSDLAPFVQPSPLAEETLLRGELIRGSNEQPPADVAELPSVAQVDPLAPAHVYRVLLDGKTIAFEMVAKLEVRNYSAAVEFQLLSDEECKSINLSRTKPIDAMAEGETAQTVCLADVAEAAKKTAAWNSRRAVELFSFVTGLNAAVPLDR